MLRPSTLQVFIKLFRYAGWQVSTLTGQLGLKLRPVFPCQLVKYAGFGLVAPVLGRVRTCQC